MNVMLYAFKRDFDVQKAERFFKERGVAVQAVDMKRHAPGMKEMRLFASQVGVKNLIDTQKKAYLESTVRFLTGEDAILEALLANPELIKGPIVREGRRVTAGYQPDIWQKWIDS